MAVVAVEEPEVTETPSKAPRPPKRTVFDRQESGKERVSTG